MCVLSDVSMVYSAEQYAAVAGGRVVIATRQAIRIAGGEHALHTRYWYLKAKVLLWKLRVAA